MPALSIVSAAAGRRLKDEGQALTLAHAGDWKDKALAEFKTWCRARVAGGQITITMEEFRSEAKAQPPSHKSWGGFTTMAKNLGLIEFDTYVRSRSEKTHAHPVIRWRIRPFA